MNNKIEYHIYSFVSLYRFNTFLTQNRDIPFNILQRKHMFIFYNRYIYILNKAMQIFCLTLKFYFFNISQSWLVLNIQSIIRNMQTYTSVDINLSILFSSKLL